MFETKDKSTRRLIQSYLSDIFLIRPLLEAKAEIQKYFRCFFGSNENFRICFRYLIYLILTFRKTVKVFFSETTFHDFDTSLIENNVAFVYFLKNPNLKIFYFVFMIGILKPN